MTPQESIDLLKAQCVEQINRFRAATSKRQQVAALASAAQIYGSIRVVAIQFGASVDFERYEKVISNMIRDVSSEPE